MYIIIKHLFNSILASLAVKKKNNGSIWIFLKALYITFFFGFSFIRNLLKEKIGEDYIENSIFTKSCSINNIVKSLSNKGYYNDLKIKKEILDNIIKEILVQNSIFSFKGKKKNLDNFSKNLSTKDNLNAIIAKSKTFDISHVGLEIDLKKTKKIKELACSNFFLNIAKNYLNSTDITISAQCYVSNPFEITEKEKKDNAQYFHYDLDFKKFFKIFIYLNDVDQLGGPHCFISKSHKKKIFRHILAERIDEIEIEKFYKPENVKSFTGLKGSVILEDTFGLHKGEAPKKFTRSVLILVYGLGEGIRGYETFIRP